jgi:peptide/nickel transport system permease protein
MARYVVRRLLLMIPLLLGITFMVFAIVNLVPGTPIAKFEANPRMSQEDIQRIRSNLGLDEPWPKRYVLWLSNLVRGDLGYSYINGASVTKQILAVLPNTLLLTLTATLFALVVAIPLGILSAVHRNSWFDNAVYVVATAIGAIPTFWIGLLAIILFAVKFNEWGLPALPVGGTHTLRGESGLLDRLRHLLLPGVTLGLLSLAGWLLYVRASMLEVVRQDYIRTAYAKGLRQRAVLYGHAFRNSLLPLVTLIGLSLPELFGGAFIIETVFSWNGMGRLSVNAATNSDYTVIMGTFLLFAVLTLFANLLSDVMYAVLDPRIRYD